MRGADGLTQRARIALGGAVLLGPLLAFPALQQPKLGIAVCLAVGVVFLASRGVAYPLVITRSWRRSEGDDRQHAAIIGWFFAAAVVNAQFSADPARNSAVWLGAGLAFGLSQRILPATSGQEPLSRLRTRWRRRGDGAPEVIDQGGRPGRLPPPAPTRATAGGAITAPVNGSAVRGEVAVTCQPGAAGWTVGSVAIERSRDGREWYEIGEAAADRDYEVFVLTPGGARRHVAVMRSERRAEEMRGALAGEHGVTPQQIEIRPAKRSRWAGRDSRETTWDTREVEDGEWLLRSVTTDVTGRRVAGPESAVLVDNEAPSVKLDTPHQGAVLMGVVDVNANVQDEGSGLALVRFEASPGGDEWREIATVGDAPFRTSWNTGTLGEGDYQLRAIALDRAGNEAISRLVPVRVERVVAAVKLEDPGECLSRTVRLEASVRDETKIEGVEFQVAAADSFAWQALGAVAQPPYEVDFDTSRVEDGAYDFRAVARDNRGGIDASRILRGRRIDNVAPDVSIAEPAASALVRGEIPLSARAADQGSGVTSVLFQFSSDGWTWRPVVSRSETAGAVYWDTSRVEDGEYRVRAVVGDAAGNLTTSEPITVRVDNTPPVVSIDEPANGAYMGGAVRLAASADDPGSGVIGVRFEWSADGVAWGELAASTVAPFGATWDTTAVLDGVYRIRAVARDRAGNSVFGEPIELTVRNSREFEPRPAEAAAAPAAAAEPEPEPEETLEPVLVSTDAATLWQLERLLEQRGGSYGNREKLEAILYTLRPYARPDGTIPERFWPLIQDAFGDLLEGR